MKPDVPSTRFAGQLTASEGVTHSPGSMVQNLPLDPPAAEPASMASSTLPQVSRIANGPGSNALCLGPCMSPAPSLFLPKSVVHQPDDSCPQTIVCAKLRRILLSNDRVLGIVCLKVQGYQRLRRQVCGWKFVVSLKRGQLRGLTGDRRLVRLDERVIADELVLDRLGAARINSWAPQ